MGEISGDMMRKPSAPLGNTLRLCKQILHVCESRQLSRLREDLRDRKQQQFKLWQQFKTMA